MCLMELTMPESEIRDALKQALSEFDWYYDRSDDYSYWAKMRGKLAHINALAVQLPDGKAIVAASRPQPLAN